MQAILPILEFIQSILTKPAWIMGLFAFVGLVALKRPAHKVMTGTLKPILGYIMLSAGAAVVQENLAPLGTFIETGFHITGVVPNNEVVVSMAQSVLGVQTMMILILGYVFPEDYQTLVDLEIRPAVFDYETAELLSQEAQKAGKVHPIHLAFDTGMTRIGFRHPKESIPEILRISKLPGITIEGAFTHFARADEQDLTFAHQQFTKYQEFLMLLEEAGIQIPVRHCNNSAGILWHREGDLDAVRPGITLYGIAPSNEVVNPGVELHPMMELKSHISFIKEVEAGVAVSYGGTFVTTKDSTRIATIPVGYADGYPRSLSNKGYVLINGKKAPIIGRVCMDQFMVDVTKIPEAKVGDIATLIGTDGIETITMEEIGDRSGRFNYETACCLGKRIPRVYEKGGKIVCTRDYFHEEKLFF